MGSRLDRITDWDQQAMTASYKTSMVARQVNVTPRQLRRYFQIKFGYSPKSRLHYLQMQQARRLLAQGRLVKEVAGEIHFEHATHFSRAFKREHGTSPAAFPVSKIVALPENVRKRSEMSEKGLP